MTTCRELCEQNNLTEIIKNEKRKVNPVTDGGIEVKVRVLRPRTLIRNVLTMSE